jgi:hypothetical protein
MEQLMERIVDFGLTCAEPFEPDWGNLPNPSRKFGPIFEKVVFKWYLFEQDWDAIAALRTELPHMGIATENLELRPFLDPAPTEATLVELAPSMGGGMGMDVTGTTTPRKKCGTCNRSTKIMPDSFDEPTVLHGPLNDCGVFCPKESGMVIMHADVHQDLVEAGLDTGLCARPVLWEGAAEFVWVYGTQPLGHALTPHGGCTPPCAECGWCKPRYGFYPLFDVGGTTGWMWSRWSGMSSPIVTQDVYRFLREHQSMRGENFKGYVRGDISELEFAFLPAEYREPEHAIPWSEKDE